MNSQNLLIAMPGLLFIIAGIPLIMRKVGPNGSYGLRVPATFEDEWVWYEANARSGRDFVVVGILQIAAIATLASRPELPQRTINGIGTLTTVVLAVGAAGIGWWRANRLLAERRHKSAR